MYTIAIINMNSNRKKARKVRATNIFLRIYVRPPIQEEGGGGMVVIGDSPMEGAGSILTQGHTDRHRQTDRQTDIVMKIGRMIKNDICKYVCMYVCTYR